MTDQIRREIEGLERVSSDPSISNPERNIVASEKVQADLNAETPGLNSPNPVQSTNPHPQDQQENPHSANNPGEEAGPPSDESKAVKESSFPPFDSLQGEKTIITGKAPADAADIIEDLAEERGADILEALSPAAAADIVEEMEPESAAKVAEEMEPGYLAPIIEEMEPDEAADMVNEMNALDRLEILSRISPETSATIERLLSYPEDSVGQIMNPEVPCLRKDLTVTSAIEKLRSFHKEFESLYYVYVVDDAHRIAGVLSMRELVFAEPETPIESVMLKNIRSAFVDQDKEEAARLLHRYDLLALPVVDRDHRLIGIVTSDDLADVIEDETTEDIHRMVGAGPEERVTDPWNRSAKGRLLWLLINLVTAFIAASVVSLFQGTIAKITILAVFMPVVAGMGGNTGGQALAVIFRALVLGDIPRYSVHRVLLRELMIALAIGLSMGLLTGVVVALWTGDPALGAVIALAMFLSLIVAGTAGASIPITMKALGFDPAQSSYIFLTTVTDVTGFFTFLGLATIILRHRIFG